MKNVFFVAFLFFSANVLAQEDKVQALGLYLENYEYPFEVNYINISNQAGAMPAGSPYQMAYMDVQPEQPNGETVMLLHGKNFNGAYWEETARALAKEGFRVIIPDQIGFGKSSKPVNFQYSFQQLALNTKALLDSLGVEKTAVLGHSMGGMLATRFALMFPERTTELVLENPIGLEDWKLKVPYRPVEWWYENELKKDYASIKNYQLQSYYDGQWKPAYDPWVNVLAGWTKNINYPLIAWNAALTYDMIFTQPVVYEFDQLEVPTLLIIGQRDRTALGKNLVSPEVRETLGNYPDLGKATARKIKNSKLVELNNVGHLPHIEAFDRFIEPLVTFLEEEK
ncbi:alpha/beta fold hydrolase [Nafulsella turpanensis]|uniref:alpha/beta fold hydrolase n=1 Tax=Nafulsella turpanensis TaxID=1265690 RepID=UPI00034D8981|nr:alpha/beta hydrolase [Nafulsella turpanensis]